MKVWHYSTMEFIDGIFESGELRPTNTAGFYAAPLLWFSADQAWEAMAATLFGRKRSDCDAIRFGLDCDDHRLMNWLDTCALAKRSRQDRRHAEKIASKRGSNPAQWYATTESIAIDTLDFQLWRNGRWGYGDDLN